MPKNSRFGEKGKEDFGPGPFGLLPKSLEREVIQVLQSEGGKRLEGGGEMSNDQWEMPNAKRKNPNDKYLITNTE